MIARISILLLALILIPDAYIYRRYLHRRAGTTRLRRAAWWMPSAVLVAYTAALCRLPDFAPSNQAWLDTYLLLLALTALPKLLFAVCSAAWLAVAHMTGTRRDYGAYAGTALATAATAAAIWGFAIGPRQLKVSHVDITFDNLPPSFDGYRIVHVSDIHAGSLPLPLLNEAVDSINACHADAVMLTGDIQNMRPSELSRCGGALHAIQARDGVFSVLGNHDYAMYLGCPPTEQRRNEHELAARERSYGWQLLMNGHRWIRRGTDSIAVAGTENDGRPPFPSRADYAKALSGVPHNAFTIMLQHDPWAWRTNILPRTNAMLTLSGHTHGGQMSVMGWRPTQTGNTEDRGLYRHGRRMLYVSSGLGGFVPFRLNMPPEIVVITLRRATARQAAPTHGTVRHAEPTLLKRQKKEIRK